MRYLAFFLLAVALFGCGAAPPPRPDAGPADPCRTLAAYEQRGVYGWPELMHLREATARRLLEGPHHVREGPAVLVTLDCTVSEGPRCFVSGAGGPRLRLEDGELERQVVRELGWKAVENSRDPAGREKTLALRCRTPPAGEGPPACEAYRGGSWQPLPVCPRSEGAP